MSPEVFLAKLEQDLFMSLVGADESLEIEDGIEVVGEDVIAKSCEFFETNV